MNMLRNPVTILHSTQGVVPHGPYKINLWTPDCIHPYHIFNMPVRVTHAESICSASHRYERGKGTLDVDPILIAPSNQGAPHSRDVAPLRLFSRLWVFFLFGISESLPQSGEPGSLRVPVCRRGNIPL